MPLLGKDVSTGRRSTSRRGSSRTDSERQRTHRQRSRRQTPPVAETFLLRSATTALHSDNSSTGLTSVDTEETDRTPVQNLVEQTRLNRHSDARDAQRRRILEANRSNTGPSAIPPSTRARVTRTSIISSLPPIHEHSSSQYTAYRPHGISPLVPRASNARWKVGRHYEQSNSMQTFSSRRRARQTAIRSRQAKRYTHQTGRYVSSRRAADTTPVTAARIYKQLYPGAPSLRRYFHGRQYGTRRDHFGRRVSSTLNLPTFIQQHRDDTTEDWPITASDYFSPRTLEALGVKRGESEDDDEDGLQILKDSDSVSSWYARKRLVHRHSSPWIRPRTYMFEANEEEILVRKMDLRLLPLLSVLYLFSFLDRVNIGNARSAGLQVDLSLTDDQFIWGSSIFFFGYVIFELPSNVLLNLWQPSKWIALLMIAWGIVMLSMAGIVNYEGLLATRFLLGAAEAGLFPGVVFYLSMWYTRAEQTVRMGLFFGAATLAGAFGGLIAYAILSLDGEGGLNGWQWIFLIEGLATIVVAVFALFLLPDFPEGENVTFLTERQRAIAVARLARDDTLAYSGHTTSPKQDDRFFHLSQIIEAFRDWKVYMYALVHILGSMPLYSFALNLPAILEASGYDGVTAQLLSAPPYLFGCILLLAVSHSSGIRGERGIHIAGSMLVGAVGFMVLAFVHDPSIQYASIILACMGAFAQLPPILSWFSNNLVGNIKRAAGTAVIISLGNLGGGLGVHLYQEDDAPQYLIGHVLSAVFLFLGAIIALLLKWLLYRENHRRANMPPEERRKVIVTMSSTFIGDNHPDFRYIH